MLNRIIDASVRFRWLVVGLAVVLAILGGRELLHLPIDAVPDITNRQVQITTVAPALGPEEVERQVTFPLETALAGLPGLTETRSLSRHGFSQITAVFTDNSDDQTRVAFEKDWGAMADALRVYRERHAEQYEDFLMRRKMALDEYFGRR